MTQEHVVLELEADVDNDGSNETGVFELRGDLEIQQGLNVDFLLDSEAATINAVTSETIDTFGDFVGHHGDYPSKRSPFYLDLGGGQHTQQINFLGWEGATTPVEDDEGNVIDREAHQWGDPSEPEGSRANATGEGPLTQIHVLMQYLRQGTYDSRSARARLTFGEYHEDGLYDDWLHVVINRAQFTRSADQPVAFNGSIRFVETDAVSDTLDALFRTGW